MGMGQTVTALYELIPADELLNNDGNMGKFTIRYRTPADGTNSKPRERSSVPYHLHPATLNRHQRPSVSVLLWLNRFVVAGISVSFQCEP